MKAEKNYGTIVGGSENISTGDIDLVQMLGSKEKALEFLFWQLTLGLSDEEYARRLKKINESEI